MGLRAKGRVLGCRVFFDDHGLLALRIWGLGLEPRRCGETGLKYMSERWNISILQHIMSRSLWKNRARTLTPKA